MTGQNTRTQQKKRERPSLPGGRENYEKLPQNPPEMVGLKICRPRGGPGKLGRSCFFG